MPESDPSNSPSERFWKHWNINAGEGGGDHPETPGPLDSRRVCETADRIPRDVKTILDAGCGSGWLARRLADRFGVVALDYVESALARLPVPAVRGDLGRLPFATGSFDLVCCCETLEHLDDRILPAALRELVRVSRKYVLVTVPHAEPLHRRYTRCRRCGVRFSPHGHVRSFGPADLPDLFAFDGNRAARCLAVVGLAPTRVFRQNAVLESLRPRRRGFWSAGMGVVCPNCSFRGYPARLEGLWRAWELALRALNALLNPIRQRRSLWLLGLYRVRDLQDRSRLGCPARPPRQ